MSLEQIQEAINYIEDNLTGDLCIKTCAKVSGYSFWHFQRIFKSSVGETISVYKRKRQLSEAIQRICATDDRLIELALEYGFESQEAFTRAFKKEFGTTPGKLRGQKDIGKYIYKRARITPEYLNHLYEGLTMTPKFVDLKEKRMVGVTTTFISILSEDADNFKKIPTLWGDFVPKRMTPPRVSQEDWGIVECRPENMRNHPNECWYMAGCEIEGTAKLPLGFEEKIVPAGRYAVFTHKGSLAKLEHTYNYIFGSWVPQNKIDLRDAPDLELYDHRFNPNSEDCEMDIYIPIQ